MKIVAISAKELFEKQLQLIKEAVGRGVLHPVAYVVSKELTQSSLSIHRSRVLEAVRELYAILPSVKISDIKDPNVIIIDVGNVNFGPDDIKYLLPVETLDVYNYFKFEGDTLVTTEYLLPAILYSIYSIIRYGCKYARDVIFDDEAVQTHMLFSGSDERCYVLKLGDAGCWLNVYDSYDDALVDYMTVDYGWKDWSPLQAQELKVKPKATRRYKSTPGLVLEFVEKHGIEEIMDAVEVELPSDPRISYVLKRFNGKLDEWIFNWRTAMAPKGARDFFQVFEEEFKTVAKDYEALLKKKQEIEKEIERTINEIEHIAALPTARAHLGRDGEVIGRLASSLPSPETPKNSVEALRQLIASKLRGDRSTVGMVVLFSDPKPRPPNKVYLLRWQVRTSKNGKQYIKCLEWIGEEKMKELYDRLESLRKKKYEVEEELGSWTI